MFTNWGFVLVNDQPMFLNNFYFCKFIFNFVSMVFLIRNNRFFLILCLIMSFYLNAQVHYKIEVKTQTGVKAKKIFDIFQDSNDFIWLTTEQGICKYNGVTFECFNHDEQSMVSGSNIREDYQGRIWYMNFDGFLFYIKNNNIYAFPQLDNGKFNVYGIIDDKLLLPLNNSIQIYSLKNFKLLKEIKIDDFIKNCYQLRDKYHILTDKLYTIDKNLNINSKSISFINDKIGISFLGFKDKLLFTNKYKPEFIEENGKKLNNVEYSKTLSFIQNFKTIDNSIWMCTTNGLHQWKADSNQINSYFPNHNFSSILKDKENNYWIGTFNNDLLFVENFDFKIEKNISEPSKIANFKNTRILGTKKDEIYFDNKLIHKTNSNHEVTNILVDSTYEKLLFTSLNFYAYDLKNNKKIADKKLSVKDIFPLDEKYYLIASTGICGVFVTNYKIKSDWDDDFNNFPKNNSDNSIISLINFNGKGVTKGLNKDIYFSTNKGLFLFKNKIFKEIKYNHKTIYLNTIITLEDEIYGLSTNKKLYKIRNYKIEEWHVANNILQNNTQNLFLKNNRLYIYDGLNVFEYLPMKNQLKKVFASKLHEVSDILINSDEIHLVTNSGIIKKKIKDYDADFNLNFKIKNVEDGKQTYPFKKQVTINPKPEFIKVNFDYINYSPSADHFLFYQINDSKWIKSSLNQSNIQFFSLQSGIYEVKFKIKDEILETFTFEIAKPWYLRWYNIFLISILILGLIFYFFWTQHKKVLKQNAEVMERIKLENRLNQSTLKAIKSQMNPHFFYNALNTLQFYILGNNKKLAVDYLTKFSKLTRNILTLNEKEFTNLEEEIETLQLYLEVEKARFNNDFEYQISLNNISDKNQFTIPAMLLQPFVENAIKHGLLHKRGAKILNIKFNNNDNDLSIIIEDNGIGRKKSFEINKEKKSYHQSYATNAIKQRIDLLNLNENLKIDLDIVDKYNQDNQPEGTKVIIKINRKNY